MAQFVRYCAASMAPRPLAVILAVGFGVLAAGCLSGGPPPTGQQLTRGRTDVEIWFVDSKPGASLLDLRIGSVGQELHALTVPPGNQPAGDLLLTENASLGSFLLPDSRGRLALMEQSGGPGDPNPMIDLLLVDVATGARLELGQVGYGLDSSPSRDRLVYRTADNQTRLHEIDDRDIPLGAAHESINTQFLDEDLYYADSPDLANAGSTLWRIAPGGAPESVADNVSFFVTLSPFLFITRTHATGAAPTLSILNPTTREEMALPATRMLSVSPDGRWVVATTDPANFQDAMSVPVVLFDTATGATRTFDFPSSSAVPPSWRPGASAEAWMPASITRTIVMKPDEAPIEIARATETLFNAIDGTSSPFTRDGAYFFALPSSPVADYAKAPIHLVPVDDPLDPGILLNPEGSGISSVSSLPDGRLLVGVYYKDQARSDLQLVDPVSGTSRLLGEAGTVVAADERRVLAKLNEIGGAGNLTLIDLDTGASTKLAESVTTVAVERNPTGDRLSPGTRVAYVLTNPVASPYDGVWIVNLP